MSENSTHHVSSVGTYLLVFGTLMVLTIITVGAAKVDLGRFNNVVALAIAATKASVVILYFMHVKYQTRLTKLAAAGGFFWLLILFTLTMQDYISRGWLDQYVTEGWFGKTLK